MAIRHVVSWKLQGETAGERQSNADAMAEALTGLVGTVPTLLGAVAKSNVIDKPGNWDLVLIADFADEAGLDAYVDHPDHVQVAKRMRELAVDRSAVDFEL